MNTQLIDDVIRVMPVLHKSFFHGIKKTDFRKYTGILMHISDNDGYSMSYYCDKMYISKPNLTKAIDALAEDGFVERREDPDDRRKTNIYVTDKGKEEARSKWEGLRKHALERLSVLSEEELEELHVHVLGMHRILEKV
ncbi:MarR family transcriptional regulator [Acidaminobacter sp. JC074]|uniref:MarR family winged helix-turn-helix transcriptional regulator n=1 Tax=Acidaminobacter sp. JC074 TaxID=2530199 RepID=UPI001F1186B0|nr:MarR family transcriptional regulator [Acidaminobacter sp. JC074]MCH4887344.1 MarR family transcriptional regulator [Acidaminobacter sp. JC074]